MQESLKEMETEQTKAGEEAFQEEPTANEGQPANEEDIGKGEEEEGGEAPEEAGDSDSPEGGEGNAPEGIEDVLIDFTGKKFESEIAAWKDKYTRLYAEFDNFRKRTEKEKSQMFELGAKDVIERLLPVVDNFERAIQTVPEGQEDAFTKGVEGIYKQIQKLFSDLDVQVIPAEGEKFDPNLHNAVMTDTESDVPEDTITQDLQKGYTYRGSVVRHSMVKVRKP